MRRQGSILVGVLWCMVLLSVLVIGTLHTARMDLIAVKNYGDRVQAHYLALAGVERAKALLYQDVVTRQHTGKNYTGSLYNDPKAFRDTALGRGKFSVLHRADQDDGGELVYGITDEERRLNLNIAQPAQFTNFAGITSDIISAIVSWRSPANPNAAANPQTTPAGGSDAEYYLSLRPPYLPRNGPFQTVRELLMVRGVTSDLLLGNDDNQNGFLDIDPDPGEPPGLRPPPPPSPGWAQYLTVNDTEKNVNASGAARVNPQTADESALSGVSGITPEIARAIVQYRAQHELQSLDDLLSVTAQNQNQNNNDGTGASPRAAQRGGQNGQNGGPTVISQDLLLQIADDLSLAAGDLQGLININTASLNVLIALPGVDRALAQNIVNYRKSSGYFDNVAQVLKVDGMTRHIFKQIASLITTRSETFRIVCEGRIPSSGARQRIEEIVHIGGEDIETLGYREDL
jgi:competence ComEA-like helix-hairpin-helix protein